MHDRYRSDNVKWGKIPEKPKNEPKIANPEKKPAKVKQTLAQRISEWGTNFMFNAKVGNNIWSALLGDKKIDYMKRAILQNEEFNLATKEGHEFFMNSFKSFIWMTYRTCFFPLLDTISESVAFDVEDKTIDLATQKLFSTDNGWGCTIRVGQMALANALIRHLYGKEFNYLMLKKHGVKGSLYEKILTDFWDNGKGKEHAFSIQNFCELALKYNKIPGDWLSHSSVATVLRDLNIKYNPYDVNLIVFSDGAIYKDSLGDISPIIEETASTKEFELIDTKEYDEFSKKEEEKTEQSKIIFVTFTMGLKNPEPENYERFKELFAFPQLMGIMGGRTNEALFYVGYQDDSIIFLDPHFVQVFFRSKMKIANNIKRKYKHYV